MPLEVGKQAQEVVERERGDGGKELGSKAYGRLNSMGVAGYGSSLPSHLNILSTRGTLQRYLKACLWWLGAILLHASSFQKCLSRQRAVDVAPCCFRVLRVSEPPSNDPSHLHLLRTFLIVSTPSDVETHMRQPPHSLRPGHFVLFTSLAIDEE